MSFIYSIPRGLLVVLLILGGIAFIVFESPPRNICDIQADSYKEQNINFLFKNKKNPLFKHTSYVKSVLDCKKSNSPGGCYALFQNFIQLLDTFRTVNLECQKRISSIPEVRQALFSLYSLFLEISWAGGPQSGISTPLAWLSMNDVSIYCKLTNRIVYFYGQNTLDQMEQMMYKKLSGNRPLEDFQKFSILSENCGLYPQ